MIHLYPTKTVVLAILEKLPITRLFSDWCSIYGSDRTAHAAHCKNNFLNFILSVLEISKVTIM
jgi:hypothetical protein